MKNFQNNNNKGEGLGVGNSGNKQMFQAVCSECKKDCEVPFRPSSDKPVYCKECFSKKRGGGNQSNSSRGDRPNFQPHHPPRPDHKPMPPHDDTRRQLAEMNSKLDRLIGAIEKMSVPQADFVVPTPKKTKETKITKKKVAINKKK